MELPRFFISAGLIFASLGFVGSGLAQTASKPFVPSPEALKRAAGSSGIDPAGDGGLTKHPGGFDRPQAPEVLPGRGLREHDFFAAGVQSSRDGKGIVMVRNGEVVWNFYNPSVTGNYYDGTMLANGNLLLAHARGVMVIAPDKSILWRYQVKPIENEIDGVQPIGTDRVVFLKNSNPSPHLLVANIKTGKIEKDITLPLAGESHINEVTYVHMQARRLRLTPQGTALVAYTIADKVAEYDENGKEVWSAPVRQPWSVERLKNGNTLVASVSMETIEMNAQGETVWKLTPADLAAQGYIIDKLQTAMRLPNGNTIITVNNETAWRVGDTPDAWAPVQAIEVNSAKKVVWALRDWKNFDVISTLQTLDDPRIKEPLHFGSFR
jgi:hypothetical protein